MRLLYLFGLLVMGLGGAAFSMENPHLVDFGYFAGRTDVALSVLLGGSFAAGTLLGLTIGMLTSRGPAGGPGARSRGAPSR